MSEGKIQFIDTYKNIIYRDNDLTKMGFTIPVMIDLSRKLEFYNLLDDIYSHNLIQANFLLLRKSF